MALEMEWIGPLLTGLGLGGMIGMLWRGKRSPGGVPHMKNIPPPPPPPSIWYRLLAHELQVGEIYRHRLSHRRVQVSKAGSPAQAETTASPGRGMMFDTISGRLSPIDIDDNDLETDNPMLHPATAEKLMRVEHAVLRDSGVLPSQRHKTGDYQPPDPSPDTGRAWRDLQS